MKRGSIILMLVLMVVAEAYTQKNVEYKTVNNILYRENSAKDSYVDSLCRLDVYYPADKKDFPTVIWLHGGSLTGGKRSIPERLKKQGFAIVGVDYRLTPRVKVADCIDDAAASAAWVVKNIAKYGGDPKKIVLAGHSAGGYLTFMLGLDKRWLQPYGLDPDSTFKALIPYSGQVVTHFSRRKELGIPDTKITVDDMAPLNYARPDCPPILMITGDREMEMLGRYEENAYFCRMMKLVGHSDITLYELDGFKHGNMPAPAHDLTVRYLKSLFK